MIVSATDLENDSKTVLDRVVQGGEVVDVQRHGETVAEIHPKPGVGRSEIIRLLAGRGLSDADSRELRQAMDDISTVVGYAGRD